MKDDNVSSAVAVLHRFVPGRKNGLFVADFIILNILGKDCALVWGQIRTELGMLKDLSAYRNSEIGSPKKGLWHPVTNSLFPGTVSVHSLHSASVFLSRLGLSWKYSKIQIFFQISFLCLSFYSSVSFPLFPKVVLCAFQTLGVHSSVAVSIYILLLDCDFSRWQLI